ncbi:MAG: hypothetical protein ABIL09_16675, partial [Gemmatimonadota bacterium]
MPQLPSSPESLPTPETSKYELTRIGLSWIYNLHRDGRASLFKLFFGRSGIFAFGGGTPLDLVAGGVVNSVEVLDGVGYIEDAAYDDWPGIVDWDTLGDITIENQIAQVYHVGMRVQEVPIPDANGVVVNRRTGAIEYAATRLEVGEYGQPDAVVYNAALDRFEFTVTTVIGNNGDNHGARTVRMWLATPASASPTVAFVTPTVTAGGVYSAVTASGQRFGLSVAEAAVAVAADFRAIMPYPRITAADLSVIPTYLYLGN